jgi:DNA-binding transcriptional MocR family regulator
MLDKRGVPLIEDDVYGDLYYGDERPLPTKAFDRTGNVMLCSSFTKTVAPGFRLGWVSPVALARTSADGEVHQFRRQPRSAATRCSRFSRQRRL